MIEYSEGDRVTYDEPHACPWRGEVVEVFRCDHGTFPTHYSVALDPPDTRVVYATGNELHPTGPAPVPAGDPDDLSDGVHEWARA
jgi:hypothetical protein